MSQSSFHYTLHGNNFVKYAQIHNDRNQNNFEELIVNKSLYFNLNIEFFLIISTQKYALEFVY